MELLDTFFKKMSLVVLPIVDGYDRLTSEWHPLLAIFLPVGVFAGVKYFAPHWLFMAVMLMVASFTSAFAATIVYMYGYCMEKSRD
ncbi:hypothetical protein [Ralstonia sp. ASV6]|uniref:hypothetical protein n=1 Tax=Ralstonia sp. ASV6 TaxID=2795124 RepID=UPI0018EC5D64|nr:hypothetical protein [Ralstonia sp. ASV6]